MLRIFLSTSHLSTLFMALHAKKTRTQECKDILIVENAQIKKSLLKLIHETTSIHKWDEIHDFVSITSDNENTKPTLRKTLTRKLKTKPIAKQIYNSLYDVILKNKTKSFKEKLQTIFKNIPRSESVELNLLTQTFMNPILLEMFPKASVRYFEHGLGDYLHSENLKGKFICLFSEQYKKYLSEKKLKNDFIFPSASFEDFKNIGANLIQQNSILVPFKEKPACILIIMESVDMYNVKNNFWEEYLAKCVGHISNPTDHTFIIKPHPAQSHESIQITKSFFEKKNLKFKLLDSPELSGMSIEYLFPLWKENTKHVFALFSSSLFYLSVLYPEPHIIYHYSYEFMKKNIGNAPEQFKQHFLGLEELIEKVFSANCKKFS